MTREEAIEILYQYSVRDMTYPKEDIEAFELAIKALEQEPCEEQEPCKEQEIYEKAYKEGYDKGWSDGNFIGANRK